MLLIPEVLLNTTFKLKIFAPFHQVDGTHTRSHEGTGLGLAITQRLVEMHNGKIEVQSEPSAQLSNEGTQTSRYGVMRRRLLLRGGLWKERSELS